MEWKEDNLAWILDLYLNLINEETQLDNVNLCPHDIFIFFANRPCGSRLTRPSCTIESNNNIFIFVHDYRFLQCLSGQKTMEMF